VLAFLTALVGWRRVSSATAPMAVGLARAGVAGGTLADSTKEELFVRILAGIPTEQAERVGRRFAREHLAHHERVDVRARFDWHQGRGDRVVIVSASPEVYVVEVGRLLGADGVIATRLAAHDGVLTGKYEGANCRGEEKLRRLLVWIDEQEIDAPDGEDGEDGDPGGSSNSRLWAYGNSRGDLRMLRAADIGVNVGRLGRWGRLAQFPTLRATEPGPLSR